MSNKMKRWLYLSFEGRLKTGKLHKLQEALAQDPELRLEKDRIEKQRKLLRQSAAESFSPGFADRVMARLDRLKESSVRNGLESFYMTLRREFVQVAVAGAVIVLLLITYHLMTGPGISLEETFFASQSAVDELQQLALF